MECIIDYTNNDIQYVASESGTIFGTTDHWGDMDVISPFDAGSGAWVTPYLMHPTDHNTLYAGYSNVWKTTDKGENWVKISTIDTDDLLESMAISSDGGTLYVADDNNIWKSTNGGDSWTKINNNLPFNSILSIAIKDGNSDVVWVTLGDYDNNGVYESTNGGTTWSNISTGLPSLPVYTIVQNKQATETNHLYVGTQIGIFFKNGSNNWSVYSDGLPNVRIGELEIYYNNIPSQSKLRAATFGRGLWESDMYLSSYNISASVSPANSGTITGTGNYNSGATANLTATAETGYNFVNWTENGTQVSTNANYSFTVSADRTLVANFETTQQTYNISASVSPANSGIITGTGDYNSGAIASLPATAETDYNFVNWTENGTEVSINANYSFTVSADRILVANFKTITGISIIDNDKSFEIYPNPTKALINIKLNDLSINNKSNIKLYFIDNIGKKIELKVINFSSNEIQTNIGDNKKGIYYLQLIINEELIKIFKVIVTD